MLRGIISLAIVPFVILISHWDFFNQPKVDVSKYSTACLDLDYTVPFDFSLTSMSESFGPLPVPGMTLTGFKEALAFKESQGDYFRVNTFGYLGKYQFGKSTLALLGIRNSQAFLHSPELQEQAFMLNSSRNKWVLRRDIKRFNGTYIAGIKVTESGILAAAHLAGPGSVKKFLRSGGVDGFTDGYGTSIRSYLKKFSGFDVSFIKPNKRAHIDALD